MIKHRFNSFSEFWPFYVSQHSRPGTRALHFIGTIIASALMVYFLVAGPWWMFPLGLIPGYAAAWLAHFLIEKNKPATFEYPVWSFVGDYKMVALMLTGRMQAEVLNAKQQSNQR